ncbi:hypothetical protein H632_c225p2 [Helicosporidium sp. ATCC 50920]|nr:hypothetical protein H632_c225p2 [Helicosporidium sp. ATCC 50920]|eukprot:KDD76441.1 hypothetical protein H632_c225p2 [Helicosporidium sp. ATCC 50920]
MGRKGAGRSSFVKATLRHKESASDSGEEVYATALHADSPAASCSPPHPPPRTQAAEAEAAAARSSDGSSESEEKGAESMGRILQRHKGELRAVRDQARRLGKKRADEAAAMEAAVLARHRSELATAEARQAEARALRPSDLRSLAQDLARTHLEKKMDGDDGAGANREDEDAAGVDGESEEDGEDPCASAARPKQSKAARRRQQRCQQEREREERIAREQAERGASERELEEAAVSERLAPHKLAIHQIPPDGHCMFRALEHQLGRRAGKGRDGSAKGDRDAVGGLRKLAASYMRGHAERFEPFVADEEGGLEGYCARLEGTAAWGGHPELVALSEALPAQILLYSAEAQEPQTFGPDGADVLRVCFLKHAFGLGEHYESVVEKGEE